MTRNSVLSAVAIAVAAFVCAPASYGQTKQYAGFMLNLRNSTLNSLAEAIDAGRWDEANRWYSGRGQVRAGHLRLTSDDRKYSTQNATQIG